MNAPHGLKDETPKRTSWQSFNAAHDGITDGALFGKAHDHGWLEDGQATDVSQLLRKPSPERAERQPVPPRKPLPNMSAAEVWARCEVATGQHSYIAKKQGSPEGMRVVPAGDELTIAGQRIAGFLAVPAYAPDGEIQSIQFVPPTGGKKLNLPGASMAGASLTLGTGDMVFMCEGVGAAWSAWRATGHRAVCCFGWGNVARIAAELRRREPAARMVICPDRGKEQDAHKIAAEVGAAVACLPNSEPDNFDVNDLFIRDGLAVVVALLESATEPPKPEPLLKPVSVVDVLSNPSPPPAFVWDGYLPRGVVALMGAHGGTGKSTIALMLAVCTALGRPLFGVATEQSKVLFVSLEDGASVVRHRLASICRAWLLDPGHLRDRLLVVDGTEHPELFAAETRGAGEITASYYELRKLVQSESIGLVLLDNASDAFGGDEIQRRQVRAFMRALAEVARLTNCAVMLLAHVDKNTSRSKKAEGGEGYSGSTAWHNSARSRLFLTRCDDGLLTLEHQKNQFGKMREPLTLEWPDGGLPQLVQGAGFDVVGFIQPQQRRSDDERAAALLRLIAEFESREQYCSPAIQARNNVHAILKSEPAFLHLKLRPDDTKRIVNQCQRAKWIAILEYRGHGKRHQRWTVTSDGRSFAGLPTPHTPTSPYIDEGASADVSANGVCPTPPHMPGGTGDRAREKEGESGVGNE